MSKLSFYRQHKINHKFQKYLTLLENRRYKSAVTKLRCSAHRLRTEIGRYNTIRNEVTRKKKKKRTCDICKEKVEDEYHFLFECQVNKLLRDKFLNEMNTLIVITSKQAHNFVLEICLYCNLYCKRNIIILLFVGFYSFKYMTIVFLLFVANKCYYYLTELKFAKIMF